MRPLARAAIFRFEDVRAWHELGWASRRYLLLTLPPRIDIPDALDRRRAPHLIFGVRRVKHLSAIFILLVFTGFAAVQLYQWYSTGFLDAIGRHSLLITYQGSPSLFVFSATIYIAGFTMFGFGALIGIVFMIMKLGKAG
jgi:hypothetical protein